MAIPAVDSESLRSLLADLIQTSAARSRCISGKSHDQKGGLHPLVLSGPADSPPVVIRNVALPWEFGITRPR
jgi:hypothetical protein